MRERSLLTIETIWNPTTRLWTR